MLMKRKIFVVIVMLLALLLTACGSSDKCKKCDKKVFKDGFCREHYFENLAGNLVSDILGDVKDTVGDALGFSLGEATKGLDTAKDGISSEIGELSDFIDSIEISGDNEAFDSIKEKAHEFLDNEISPDDDEETVKEKIKDALGSVKDDMKGEIEGFSESETKDLKNAIDELLGMF